MITTNRKHKWRADRKAPAANLAAHNASVFFLTCRSFYRFLLVPDWQIEIASLQNSDGWCDPRKISGSG